MRSPLVCAVVLTVAAFLLPGTAHAIPPYPGDLKTALTLSYTPQCSICHEGGVTGLGTVTTPFGVSMRGHGLTDDPSTFMGALSEMEADDVDSVGRGYSDIEAIKMDVDPNVVPPDAIPTSPLPPSYGCAMSRREPQENASGGALSMLLALAVVRACRRARRA